MEKRRILIVDDDRESVETLAELLGVEGHGVSAAGDAASALHKVKAWGPHVVLLEVNLPDTSGLELLPRIRAQLSDDYAAVMLVTANSTLDDVRRGLEAGADDYLTKPFRTQELTARIRALLRVKELHDSLRRANHRIEELLAADDLTGLLHLRSLSRRAGEEVLRCRRFRKPIAALVMNLDGFASLNDALGLSAGNQVLREVAQVFRRCVRSVDLIGRVGADEFLAVLPETDLAGAQFVAERMREAVSVASMKIDKQPVRLTTCVGVAGFPADRREGDLDEIFRNAHEALRTAKATGPDRVEIYAFI